MARGGFGLGQAGNRAGFVERLRTAVRAGNVDDALITYLESAPDTLPLPGLVKAMEETHASGRRRLSVYLAAESR